MPQSADDKLLVERIEQDFSYQPPRAHETELSAHVRILAKDMARYIADVCPDNRARAVALTKLQEAVLWAHQSITRSEP